MNRKKIVILLSLLICTGVLAGSPALFNGSYVKFLKDKLKFKGTTTEVDSTGNVFNVNVPYVLNDSGAEVGRLELTGGDLRLLSKNGYDMLVATELGSGGTDDITISTGAAITSGDTGDVTITTGNVSSGTGLSGDLNINTGTSANGQGSVSINAPVTSINGRLSVVSTTASSSPCPIMTTSNMEAVVSPVNGSCVYNTDEDAQYNYNSTLSLWVVSGSLVNVENITDWVSFTPVANNFGTITTAIGKWRRVGDSMEIEGSFIAGTGTASAGSIDIPNGELIATSKISGANQNILGNAYRNVGTNQWTAIGGLYVIHSDLSDTDSVFYGNSPSSTGVLRKSNGNDVNSEGLAFHFTVPIEGWESSTKYASTTCDGLACFNTFSAKVSLTGTVSDENLNWIDGNCVITGTSIATCTYVPSLVTVAMNCNSTAVSSSVFSSVRSSTTSLMSANAVNDSGSATASDLYITCHRAGADFFDNDDRFIQVNDQENVYSAVIANAGTASVTSENTGFISTVTRTATGVVDVVFNPGTFTVTPSVVSTINYTAATSIVSHIYNATASGFTIRTFSTSNVSTDRPFSITVTNQGADYREPKAYIGIVQTQNQTLAEISTESTTDAKSLYTMQAGINVEFDDSSGGTLLTLGEADMVVGIGTDTPLAGDDSTNILDVGGSTQVNAAVDPIMTVTGNSAGIIAMQLQNTDAAGEMRFISATSSGEYQAFTTPGNSATGSFGGVNKSDSVFWFYSKATGSNKDMSMINLGAAGLNFGVNNDVNIRVHNSGGVTFGTGLTGSDPGTNEVRFQGEVRVDDKLGIATSAPLAPLDIQGDTMRLRVAKTPASATETCNVGTIAWDVSYIYICTTTNNWKRTAIATW